MNGDWGLKSTLAMCMNTLTSILYCIGNDKIQISVQYIDFQSYNKYSENGEIYEALTSNVKEVKCDPFMANYQYTNESQIVIAYR